MSVLPLKKLIKMIISEINNLLGKNFEEIHNWVMEEGSEKWTYTPSPNRWSVGQHIFHLRQANNALLKGLKIPNIIKRYQFGKRNRASRNYDVVVQNYNNKLSKIPPGTVAPISKSMPQPKDILREKCLKDLYILTEKIKKKSTKLSDNTLDNLLLPHPLMGKMTIRELLMWNAYHTQHHLSVLKKDYL